MNIVRTRGYLESWPDDALKIVRLGRSDVGRETILARQRMAIPMAGGCVARKRFSIFIMF
jgi:hypothetical protein